MAAVGQMVDLSSASVSLALWYIACASTVLA